MAQPDAELPGYAARAPNTMEHRYQLDDSKSRPWLWLSVKSRSKDAKQLPLFFEHDTISGTVEVDLDKAEGSKGVLISVGPPHANLSCRVLAPLRQRAPYCKKVVFPFGSHVRFRARLVLILSKIRIIGPLSHDDRDLACCTSCKSFAKRVTQGV